MFLKNNAYELRESTIHYRLTIIITAKAITKTIPPTPATSTNLIDLLVFEVQIHVYIMCLGNNFCGSFCINLYLFDLVPDKKEFIPLQF